MSDLANPEHVRLCALCDASLEGFDFRGPTGLITLTPHPDERYVCETCTRWMTDLTPLGRCPLSNRCHCETFCELRTETREALR
jgi:hypothetical protein